MGIFFEQSSNTSAILHSYFLRKQVGVQYRRIVSKRAAAVLLYDKEAEKRKIMGRHVTELENHRNEEFSNLRKLALSIYQ